MTVKEERDKESLLIRFFKQIGFFIVFTMFFAIFFSFLQPRVYKTYSEYLAIKEKYNKLNKEYDFLRDNNLKEDYLIGKKEELVKENEKLKEELNFLHKEIKGIR